MVSAPARVQGCLTHMQGHILEHLALSASAHERACPGAWGMHTDTLLSLAHSTVGFQEEFLELVLRFHGTMRGLKLQQAEYVLLAAVVLFSPDRPGVTKRDHIDHLQENVALTLQSYIRSQQTAPRNRYKKGSEGPIQPTPTQLTRPGWHPLCTPQQLNFPRLYSVDIKVAAGSQLSLSLGPSPWPAPDYPIQLPMALLHSQL